MEHTILDTLNPDVAILPLHMDRLKALDKEDLGFVRKKVALLLKQQGANPTDDYLDRGILALKQYYAVAILDAANAHAISQAIDPFWHAHLLFTERYQEFCERTAGYLMSHEPLDFEHQGQVNHAMALYGYTLEVLGPRMKLDPEFWTPMSLESVMCSHVDSIQPENPLHTTSLNPKADWRVIWPRLSESLQVAFSTGTFQIA